MELRETIDQRTSIRKFLRRPVPQDLIADLLQTAHLAPSAGNLQAREFLAVWDQTQKDALSTAALDQTFLADAPVVIVACADASRITPYGPRGVELYMTQDVAAAVAYLQLLATDAGLATCWVGAFKERSVAEICGLPAHLRPQALVPIGYAAEPGDAHDRRTLDIHTNRW